VYNARLCAAFARKGHAIELLTQDRQAAALPFVDAVGRWVDGAPEVEVLREPVRVTAWRPDIGAVLPVYVADRYDGFDARPFAELSDDALEDYIARNVAAVRDVCALRRPDIALANHLVMGPTILARALGGRVPYAVKIHGSALEYVVKRDPARFLPYAREGLAGAAGVLVGSRHTAHSLWAAMDDPALEAKTRLGPPGVDLAQFHPRPPAEAAAELRTLIAALHRVPPSASGDAFWRDERVAAGALERLDLDGGDRHVAFVGKLLRAKGVDLLAAAWPLVLAHEPRARLVVVGFGALRDTLERLLALLGAGDLDGACALAVDADLSLLEAFLGGLAGERRAGYLRAAVTLPERVVLTGRLEHDEVAVLISACEAQVVPSTFPEAFGMVAVEAAACGTLPLSAAHSGLVEVSEQLAAGVPAAARELLSFAVGPGAIEQIAQRLTAWLDAPAELREATREGLVAVARERYSWDRVADGVQAAALGRLDALPPVEALG
jgi:glycosyltransferase involved in cell wall biosynthesis